MEFAIFLNGYIPGPAAHDTEMQHLSYMREAQYAIFADKHNWKYCWFGEHHGLVEYSQLSAPEVMIGYVAAQTDYIHLGTAINSLSPRKEHPVRFAERAATMDHFTNNRFEWGTGRGAGSHEMKSFNILDKDSTKPEWNEVVREVPRMWEQIDYEFRGESFTVPTPHNILPKPYGKGHPPIWVACGNPPTFQTAGEMGIGAIAFNFEPIFALRGRIEAYKEGIANCTDPIGQFKNDNVMITNSVICCETRQEARHMVQSVDSDELLDGLIAGGYMLCGSPDDVAEQIAAWGDVGMDQLAFGLPIEGLHHEEILACLELFGDKVIPEFDRDRTHSTDRFRATSQPKHGMLSGELPNFDMPSVLPESALKQLA
jgi:alkanesulfonate monooxygenase SsuD/methylene tetrahydromethanopterin reductase-like flavin-dependent oxidoreductase (luciferase family)